MNQHNQKPRLSLDKKPKDKKPQQRRLDAHEFKLVEAKRDQTEMRFNTTDGRVTGIVTNFDKYSVVVKDKSTGRELCLFKHAIHSFLPSEYAPA